MGTPGFEIPPLLKTRFQNYWLNGSYDEMFEAEGLPRPHYRALYEMLLSLPVEEMRRRKQAADVSFLHQGITFTVYGREEGTERIFPHDLLPRIITSAEWETIERGLTQRITALNLFPARHLPRRPLPDGRRGAARNGLFAASTSAGRCAEFTAPKNIYVTVVGTDLIRLPDGRFVVLEDNLRVPSGVSYMLTSRQVMKRIFPELFRMAGVRPIDHYSEALLATLARAGAGRPRRAEHRAAHAGRVQLGVLRARVPGAPDGNRAGGRPRPGGARQRRLHAHHRRAAARGRDLPPRGRRLHRSAGVSVRFHLSAWRDCSMPIAPAT